MLGTNDRYYLEREAVEWDGSMSYTAPSLDAFEASKIGIEDEGVQRLERLLDNDTGTEPGESPLFISDKSKGALAVTLDRYAREKAAELTRLENNTEDTELEAVDDAKRSMDELYGIANRRAEKLSGKALDKVESRAVRQAEKRLEAHAERVAKKRAQKSWGQSAWYKQTSKAKTARLERKLKRARLRAKPSRLRWLLHLLSGFIIFALVASAVMIGVALISAIGAQHEAQESSGMSITERKVAEFLKDKELDEVHVAAILANIRAESGGAPGDEFNAAAVEGSGGGGRGLCQWTGGRFTALVAFANERDKPWQDLDTQLDYFWQEYSGSWSGAYTIRTGDSPPPGTYVTGSKTGFESTDDVKEACKEFCYGWERPGIPHEDKRLEYALWYLSALKRGVSANDITAAAYQVADNATPYVYGGNSIWGGCDCSYFTQWCYAQAGITIPRTDITQRNAGRTIPISEAQSGDILWMPGHVGIYIDENTVIEQTPPYCRVTPITYQAWQCAVRFD